MKKIVMVVLALGLMGFMTLPCHASNVSIGDTVEMTGYLSSDGYNGGIMTMYNVTTNDTWGTFCVDYEPTIYLNKEYTVSGFSDPHTYETAYLYWNFTNGTLTGWDGSVQDQKDLQRLLWNLEDGKAFANTSEMTNWLTLANAAGWNDYHGIKVLELGNNVQPTLVATSVPIPGAVWLLGSGLFGLLGLRREFQPDLAK